MLEIPLSPYGRASGRPSQVSLMMSQFAAGFRPGVDVNLGVGYVNEQTIPRELIHRALGEIVAHPQEHLAAFNYGGPVGSDHLIAALKRFFVRRPVAPLTEEDLASRRIVIGASGATSLLEAAASVLPRGIALTADPVYYIYTELLTRLGFEVIAIPEGPEGLSPEALEETIEALGRRAGEIQLLYLVTANNPTCTLLSTGNRRGIMRVMSALSERLGRRVPVLLDTAYELLVHDQDVAPVESALRFDPLGIAHEFGTLSKVLAPALRIGYVIGRDSPFLHAIIQRVSDVGFSGPLLSQEIAAYLLDHCIEEQLARVTGGYREKAARVRAAIDAHLGEHLEACGGGRVGFYFYLTFRGILTDEDSPFFRYLSRTTGDSGIDGPRGAARARVFYLPGLHCVAGSRAAAERGARQLRIAYGYESIEAIEGAIAMMGEAARYAAEARVEGVRV